MVTIMVLKWAPIFEWRVWLGVSLRTALDYGEEVHELRILEEWSNMIGYGMGSSLAGVYSTAKAFLVENFQHR